jgi:hypothetical protein
MVVSSASYTDLKAVSESCYFRRALAWLHPQPIRNMNNDGVFPLFWTCADDVFCKESDVYNKTSNPFADC